MNSTLKDRHLFFFGKLAGMSRKNAETLVRGNGAKIASTLGDHVDLIVVGEANPLGKDWLSLADHLNAATRKAFERGALEILTETQLWERLDLESPASPLSAYTPAMLSELTGIPTSTLRLWIRRGFLIPSRQVGKLPYFDFQEILAAQQLRTLFASGCSTTTLSKRLADLKNLYPEDDRILLNLVLAADGKTILYRRHHELFDDAGQCFFDFTGEITPEESGSIESEPEEEGDDPDSSPSSLLDSIFQNAENPSSTWVPPSVFPWEGPLIPANLPEKEKRAIEKRMGERIVLLCEKAQHLENAGHWDEAIRCYRLALCLGGADADLSFQLAELFFRMNRLEAARERYYMVLEMEEDHLEARVGLGRVATLLHEVEEAVAVYRGALAIHPGYLEVHYLLGALLFDQKEWTEAEEHLQIFRNADPDSPQIDSVDLMLEKIRRGE